MSSVISEAFLNWKKKKPKKDNGVAGGEKIRFMEKQTNVTT